MAAHVEHELGLAGELLAAHEAEVVCVVVVLPLGRVVRVVVREVGAAALVDHGGGGHGRRDAVPVQDLLVLVVVVQQLQLLLVRQVHFVLLWGKEFV